MCTSFGPSSKRNKNTYFFCNTCGPTISSIVPISNIALWQTDGRTDGKSSTIRIPLYLSDNGTQKPHNAELLLFQHFGNQSWTTLFDYPADVLVQRCLHYVLRLTICWLLEALALLLIVVAVLRVSNVFYIIIFVSTDTADGDVSSRVDEYT